VKHSWIENPNGFRHALVPLLYIEIFIFEKHQNLDFWWNFKVSSLGRFGQIWAVLGKNGQKFLH
jgi:hypothetical protein